MCNRNMLEDICNHASLDQQMVRGLVIMFFDRCESSLVRRIVSNIYREPYSRCLVKIVSSVLPSSVCVLFSAAA